jgi:hypothetical protein
MGVVLGRWPRFEVYFQAILLRLLHEGATTKVMSFARLPSCYAPDTKAVSQRRAVYDICVAGNVCTVRKADQANIQTLALSISTRDDWVGLHAEILKNDMMIVKTKM